MCKVNWQRRRVGARRPPGMSAASLLVRVESADESDGSRWNRVKCRLIASKAEVIGERKAETSEATSLLHFMTPAPGQGLC